MKLKLGDCLEVLKKLEDNSVDAVVTDPPYGLKFMNKGWDYEVPSVEIWSQVLRVLKPGGHLLSFGGTRTYHRMVVAIEDAGFEIRDQIMWLYGQGFPKSLDVSKAIDKMHGAEREVVGRRTDRASSPVRDNRSGNYNSAHGKGPLDISAITAPSTPDAIKWQGWGTALKPANEPIVLARKPLSEKTVAANVLKWGTGGLNIDASRIEGSIRVVPNPKFHSTGSIYNMKTGEGRNGEMSRSQGRFPANLLLDETAAQMLDEQSGVSKSTTHNRGIGINGNTFKTLGELNSVRGLADIGGASRFFYIAKASKRERNQGLDADPQTTDDGRPIPIDNPFQRGKTLRMNNHPTVKPIKLMEYLCRLITPPNGIILDPFMGSGSTGIAALNLGFQFIGVEREGEYFDLAKARLG